jgi:hypothetical protein
VQIAFPGQTPNPDLVTLLNLEIWGLPTSNPAADPGNGGFVYQRFQRGIMHFRAEVPVTEGILVGEYLKAVITGRGLPPDLAEDMQSSRFRAQYSPGSPGWLARPGELPNTDMNGAFEPGSGPVAQPPAPATPTPGAPTSTPVPIAPTVTIQVEDPLIDSGQSVRITLIARHSSPIDWIEWEGIEGEDITDEEFSPATDPQLARQQLACDGRTDCAQIVTIAPTTGGRYTLRARARDTAGVRSEWTGINFRVRPAHTPTITPTPLPAATATAIPTETPIPATPEPTVTPAPTSTPIANTPTATATVVAASGIAPTATMTATPSR